MDIAKSLKKITQEAAAAPDLLQSLHVIAANVQDILHADATSIFLTDDERGEYVLMATLGLNPEQIQKARIKYSQGLVGLVGKREESINVQDATDHPDYHHQPDLEQDDYKAFVGVPIISNAQLLGVMTVQQKQTRFFEEDEVAFLTTLSTQIAGDIAVARQKGVLHALMQKGVRKKKKPTVLNGIPGASGVAIGQAVVVYPPADLDAVPDRAAGNIDEEIQAFETALAGARDEIHELQTRAKKSLSVAENALFDVYLRILDSRSLMNEVEDEIKEGQWAQAALKRVIKRHILQFESLDDPYLQERASDFRDLGRRILAHLQASKRAAPEYPKKTILVSEEVTATALMEVPREHLMGVVSGSGSSNSHVAILARALGLPTAMGVSGTPITQLAGHELIVDGYNGQVYVSPSAQLKKEFRHLAQEEEQLDEQLNELRDLPTETQDGHAMSLHVNTGLAADGGLSLSAGADGVGLYRTEMPFMLRERFPSEEEQRIMYRQLLNTFTPRPVVMRTLDIGGDKALSYFPVEEDNPFLGWRGIRISLDHPDIFLQQLRAMLAASLELNNLAIMFPMITSVSELEESLRLLSQAYEDMKSEHPKLKMPKTGLMIEVPAAIYQAQDLAKRVDFVSVGTNDLTQYLLAIDRNNPRVAGLYNGLHPAVLRALMQIAKNVKKTKRSLSVCGELASDPIAAVLLMAMGYDSLSMSARGLSRIKWVIRQFTMERAKALLKEVLEMDDPVDIRGHMEMALEEVGLGGLIRAGK